ncbi:hypothetical protein QM012_004707 [Aureobasidium pullulans]|uniref:Uncharacterized protein n=1 Tax=Aureobasidium pullulans TaxID=5580 RepID=A0ABR0TTW1_AURPU
MTTATNRRSNNPSIVHKKHDRHSEGNKSKKEKKYVTTNVIFKAKPDRAHKRTKSSPKSRKSGLGKNRLHRELSSSPLPRKTYTLADESNEALNNYRSHVVDDSDQMLARAYKDLIQKLDQTTLGPESLSTKIALAVEATQAMCTSFARQSYKVQVKDDDENIVRRKAAIIGDTMTTFEQLLHKGKEELEFLWDDWEDVRQKIAETGAQVLRDPKFPTQFGLDALDSRLSQPPRTTPEVENIRRLIKKESDNAHKELDQEAKNSVNKHKEYRAMWKAWLDDELN